MKDNDDRQNQFSSVEVSSDMARQELAPREVYKTEEVSSGQPVELSEQQSQADIRQQQEQPSPQSVAASQVPAQDVVNVEQTNTQSIRQELTGKKRSSSKKILLFAAVLVVILMALFAVFYRLQQGQITWLGKKGEIVWWGIMEEDSVVKPLIEEYQEKNPNIKIIYQRQSTQDYRVRLTNSLAGGKGPDVFEFHNSWVPMFSNELSVIPDSTMSQSEYSQTFYSIVVSDLLTDKGLVGIPLFYDAITLFINEDIFASVARTPPKTWNELTDLVSPETGVLTLTDGKGVIIQSGVALGTTSNIDFWQDILALMMVQNGADLKKPVGEQAFDALRYYRFFSKLGSKVWDESLPDSTIAFGQGKLAMYFGPSRMAYEVAKINSNLRFKTIPLPQLAKNFPTDPDVTYATYWVQGVWDKSANKDEAWKFLKYLSERASLERLNRERKTVKNFEWASPRMDMARIYIQDPILSSVVALAQNARSWYMADQTYDGETGINSRLAELYEKAVNVKNRPEDELEKIAPEIARVLSQYGIVKITPTPVKKN